MVEKLNVDSSIFMEVVRSPEQLDLKLKEYSLNKYVDYETSYHDLFEAYPFIKMCFEGESLRSKKMNDFLGYELLPYGTYFSSLVANLYLNACYKAGKI